MPKNDEGEFELILGNRQLLSVFFIVVILLGVFFTMGYIVGRNSAPVLSETLNGPKNAPSSSDSAASRDTAAPAPSTAPTEAAPRPSEAEPEPAQPARESARKESPASPPASSTKTKAEAKPAPKETKAKAATTGSSPVPGQSYLQLAATSKHEADIMVDVLRNKGFKSLAAEIEEKPGTYRVLVGPIADGGTNKMRADLQQSGFPGNAAIRRTF